MDSNQLANPTPQAVLFVQEGVWDDAFYCVWLPAHDP